MLEVVHRRPATCRPGWWEPPRTGSHRGGRRQQIRRVDRDQFHRFCGLPICPDV